MADDPKTDRHETVNRAFSRQIENIVPKVEIRYVLYSPTRGVYLGQDVWSKDEAARTRVKAITMAWIKLDRSAEVKDAVEYECVPDLPDGYASKARISDIGLPGW